MHNFSVSNVSLTGPKFGLMKNLYLDIGIEIFYEWGGQRFYELALADIFEGRKGKFSIHAPFQYINFSSDCDEGRLFSYLTEPFDMYHRFGADGYVLHTDAPLKAPLNAADHDHRVKTVEERLYRFNRIANENGVNLLVENLCVGRSGYHLLSEEEYLQLFINNSELNCLIDVGHANCQKMNIENIQKTLGARIKAYHLHDNDGIYDSHLPVFRGTVEWNSFTEGVKRYTPEADIVLEYDSPGEIDGFNRDVSSLRALLT